MSYEKNSFKKPLQIFFTEYEWSMIHELEENTNADSFAAVIRAALLKYYKQRILDKQIKEGKKDA